MLPGRQERRRAPSRVDPEGWASAAVSDDAGTLPGNRRAAGHQGRHRHRGQPELRKMTGAGDHRERHRYGGLHRRSGARQTRVWQYLEKYHKNPLFLGIRYGTLWNRDLGAMLSNPEFVSGLKRWRRRAWCWKPPTRRRPDRRHARTTDKVPGLRIVSITCRRGASQRFGGAATLMNAICRELGEASAGVAESFGGDSARGGPGPYRPNFYKPRLDELFGIFGEDHVLFGSDSRTAISGGRTKRS